eukprot:320515-Chlamydomonas_euryale.AAC.2
MQLPWPEVQLPRAVAHACMHACMHACTHAQVRMMQLPWPEVQLPRAAAHACAGAADADARRVRARRPRRLPQRSGAGARARRSGGGDAGKARPVAAWRRRRQRRRQGGTCNGCIPINQQRGRPAQRRRG